jgi:4-amino-4-deoxy-L-arabinose transferase-like glycosyltransferase
VPWYYLVYRQYGFEYIRSFLVGENLGRYAEAMGEQSRGVLFYIPVMLADLFPWSLLIPVALWWAFRERANNVVRLLLIWVAAIVVFFSLSGTKEDLYVLPIVTAEAALIGAMIAAICKADLASEDVARSALRAARPALVASAGLLAIAGVAVIWVFGISHRYALHGAVFVGAVAGVGGLASALAAGRGRIVDAAVAMAGTLAVVSWCIVLWSLPDFERYKPVRPFAAIIRRHASEGSIVGSYKFALPSMVFYLDRPIMGVDLPDHLRAAFFSSSDVYFVMPEDAYLDVKARLPVTTYVLARQPMFDLQPKNFLDGSELEQFVLISNRPLDGVAR